MKHYKIPSFESLKKVEQYKSILEFSQYIDNMDSLGFTVYDVETSLINKDKSIFNQDYVFVRGALQHCLLNGERSHIAQYSMGEQVRMHREVAGWVYHVGHNLPFDMHVLNITAKADCHFYWDTSVAQYLLSDQKMLYPSLQDSCAYYSIPLQKEDKVSEMIKAGVDPKDIPPELLEEYLINDINMTRELFLAQIADLKTRPVVFQNLVMQHMVWRANTYNASRAGIRLDIPRIEASIEETKKEIKELEDKIIEELKDAFNSAVATHLVASPIPYELAFEVSPDSPKQLSTYLYGGEIEISYEEIIGTYKTGPKKGTIKTRKTTLIIPVQKRTIKGKLTTDNTSLQSIININKKRFPLPTPCLRTVELCERVLKYRTLNKNISTYFEGYSQHADNDGRVHPQFNHTATPTGRLTCNKPNTQNTKGDD